MYSPTPGDPGPDLGDVLPRAQLPGPGFDAGDRRRRADLAGLVAQPAVLGDQLQLTGVPALDHDSSIRGAPRPSPARPAGMPERRGGPVEGEQRRLTRGESHGQQGAPAILPHAGVRADLPGPAVDPVGGSDAGQGHLDLDRLPGLVQEVVQVQVQQVTVLTQVAQHLEVLAGELRASRHPEVPQRGDCLGRVIDRGDRGQGEQLRHGGGEFLVPSVQTGRPRGRALVLVCSPRSRSFSSRVPCTTSTFSPWRAQSSRCAATSGSSSLW